MKRDMVGKCKDTGEDTMTNAAIGIERYLGEATLNAFQRDFSFLTKMVVASHGEYDLQLRRGYVSM